MQWSQKEKLRLDLGRSQTGTDGGIKDKKP